VVLRYAVPIRRIDEMKRLYLLLGLVVAAAVLLLPSVPAGLGAGAPPISLASIPDQTLDLYPGLIPTTPTTVPLTVAFH
jgi:hypothetical protein